MQNNFLKFHIAPFILSLLIVFVGIYFLPNFISKQDAKLDIRQYILPENSPIKISDHADGLTSQHHLESFLKGGKIVLFGSSELSSPSPAVAHRFFNDKLNIPLLSFGTAGQQSMAILTQLASLYDNSLKENARIAIILSPGWFGNNGTHIDSFLKAAPTSLLLRLYNESNAPYETKNYIASYIEKHIKDFSFPPPTFHALRYWYAPDKTPVKHYKHIADILSKTIDYAPYKIFETYQKQKSSYFDSVPSFDLKEKNIDWNMLFKKGQEEEKRISKGNPYGINDDYFKKHIVKKIKKGKFPQKIEHVSQYSGEYQDFMALADFCDTLKIKPLFIITPLNRKALSGTERYNSVLKKVTKRIKESGFGLLNLWESNEEGLMTDMAHLGEYGWYHVDKGIYDHFIKKGKR